MIYLRNTTEAQRVRIPADGAKLHGQLTLRLVNVIGGEGVDSVWDPRCYLVDAEGLYVHDSEGRQIVTGEPDDRTRLYYYAVVELPDGIPDGEYNYTAGVDGTAVSCGLAYVGDFAGAGTDYNNTFVYEQYRQ